MVNSKKVNAYLILTFAILSFSVYMPTITYAAPLAVSEKDWEHTLGNSWGHTNSPQTKINRENVESLEVKWLFSVGAKALGSAQIQPSGLIEGANTPPIVKDGKVFIQTNWLRTYAVNASNGRQIWVNDYEVDIENEIARVPAVIGRSTHSHGFRYWEGGNQILRGGPLCDFEGIDADTGEQAFRITDLCIEIPGNVYDYVSIVPGGNHEIATWEAGRQFIIYMPGGRGGAIISGRPFIAGIDMDNQRTMWRVFLTPPYDASAPEWALENCDIGWFPLGGSCNGVVQMFGRDALMYDWQHNPGEPMNPFNGVSSGWGQPVVDEDTGIIYIPSTGNQSPYTNVTFRPGPNLYGSTIMAIDMNVGRMKWWLQPLSHDPWDYDCNWSGVLVDHPSLGKVFVKGCKEGILYVMDAATGEPKFVIDIYADDPYHRGHRAIEIPDSRTSESKVLYTDSTGKEYSYTFAEWLKLPWPGYPDDPQIEMNPPLLNGAFATDISYNDGVLFHYTMDGGRTILDQNPIIEGQRIWSSSANPVRNTSITARDLATGEIKWEVPPLNFHIRAHMLVTGDMVISPMPDGALRFYDEENGALLREINMGSTLVTGISTGQDSEGNQYIFGVLGQTTQIGSRVPGTLYALGLSEKAAAEVKTTTLTTTTSTTITSTTTRTTTSVSTTTQTITSTSTRFSTSTATSTTTMLTTSTIVSTAAPSTTTVTSEITEESGLPAEITYAAVAVAVVAIIAAAFLMMRKR